MNEKEIEISVHIGEGVGLEAVYRIMDLLVAENIDVEFYITRRKGKGEENG